VAQGVLFSDGTLFGYGCGLSPEGSAALNVAFGKTYLGKAVQIKGLGEIQYRLSSQDEAAGG
jgi:hypothetical protein